MLMFLIIPTYGICKEISAQLMLRIYSQEKKTIENIIELRVPHKDGVQIEAVNKKKICGFETR